MELSSQEELPKGLLKQQLKEQEKERKLQEKNRKKKEKEERKRRKQSCEEVDKQNLIEHQQQVWKEQYERELPEQIEQKISHETDADAEHWMTDKLKRIYQSLTEDFNDDAIMKVSSNSGLQREAVIKMLSSHYSEIIQKQIIAIVENTLHGQENREVLKWEKECSEHLSSILHDLWEQNDQQIPCVVLIPKEVRESLIDTYVPFATSEIRRLIQQCTNKVTFKEMKKQILNEDKRELHIPNDIMDICDEHLNDASKVNPIVHWKIYLLLYEEIARVLQFYTDEMKKLLHLGDSKYHTDNSLHYITYTIDQINNFSVFHERISRITKERTGLESHEDIYKDFQDLLQEVKAYGGICYSTFFKHVVFELIQSHLSSMTKLWFKEKNDQLPVNSVCDHIHRVYSRLNNDYFCKKWKKNVCQEILRRCVASAKQKDLQCPRTRNEEKRKAVVDKMWSDVSHIVRAIENTDASRDNKDGNEDENTIMDIFDHAIQLIRCHGLPDDDIKLQTALMINLSDVSLDEQLEIINCILYMRGDVSYFTRRQILSGYKPT